MIVFADQADLDRYVQRVILAHLDTSEGATKKATADTVEEMRGTLPEVAAELLGMGSTIAFAVQRAAVMKLPLPTVRR